MMGTRPIVAPVLRWLEPATTERAEREVLPRLRGRSHQAALVASIPAAVVLVSHASTTVGKVGCAIYMATLTGLFLTSSIYNRSIGTARLRPWMRWTDHAMIYALIAGSYTPSCLAVLPRRVGIPLLATVWTAAIVGSVAKFALKHRFRLAGGVLYTLIGCAALVALPQLFRHAPVTSVLLYLGGGALYGIGGLSLYRRSPDPRPDLFGYHEVWHLFVIGGASAHFAATWLAVTP
jgi:hemolysin III